MRRRGHDDRLRALLRADRSDDLLLTFYAWKAKYGGMGVSDARRLRELEEENRRLKHIVAKQALDIRSVNLLFLIRSFLPEVYPAVWRFMLD